MSKQPRHASTSNVIIDGGGLFFIAFLILKFAGSAPLAAWSLWWVFLPIVPVLSFVFQKAGWI